MTILRYKILNFNDKDSSRQLSFNKDVFSSVIDSTEFKGRIKSKQVFGTFSHESRDRYLTERTKSVGSMEDFLLSKGLVANIITKIDIIDDDVIVDMLLPDFQQGKQAKAYYEIEGELQVSMSVMAKIVNGEYHLQRFNGVDFTTDPAFATELLNKSA